MNADDDVMAIRKLIDDWSAAVRRRDYDGALENRSADMLIGDSPKQRKFLRGRSPHVPQVRLRNVHGVDLYLDQQHLDTTTPTGKLLFHRTGASSEFE